MQRAQLTYLLTLAAALVFGLGLATGWAARATLTGRWYVVLLGGVALTALGLWLNRFVRAYLFDLRTLAEDARLILHANPAHRTQVDGTETLEELSDLFNEFATRLDHSPSPPHSVTHASPLLHPPALNASLTTLPLTAFDTETTGLDPSRDAIISLGAVRIECGHLLDETLYQLVDPSRAVPRAATAVHGIETADVRGQPTLDVVLPRFVDFADGTVLLGHNIAFDRALLDRQRPLADPLLDLLVLDTLLLSAALHPTRNDHSLEAVAARLGVPVQGRHSALGDAQTAAQIFTRMLPLLAAHGITTLAEAQAASQSTPLARIRY